MNLKSFFPAILASAVFLAGSTTRAQQRRDDVSGAKNETTASAGKLIPVGEKESAWAAKARPSYPFEVCVTSDEKLGSMGKSPEYIYRLEGKPDRLVIFCCAGCEEDFMKAPVKYLAKLDAAAKSKSAPARQSDAARAPQK